MNKGKIKKTGIIAIFSLLVISIIAVIGLYIGNKNVRDFFNKKILKKELGENDLPYVELDSKDNSYTFAYGSNVAILSNNNLKIYNQSAKKISDIEVNISNPKAENNGNYLLIGDEGGSSLYLIYNDTLQWKKDVEGEISQITLNKQGAVGVVISGTTYKSVIIMYDVTGDESFKTYLSTTIATDVALSDDSQYLSFVEMNATGTSIVSNVKSVSVEKAKNTPSEAIINSYSIESGSLIINIKYKRDKIIAFADDAVYILENGKQEKLFEIDNSISFCDINLDGYVCNIKDREEKNEYELDIYNVDSKKNSTYILNETVKKIYCYKNVIAVNLGNEVVFVNTSAWMIKKFIPVQNFKEIVLGNNVAAIIYKDRVEFLSL